MFVCYDSTGKIIFSMSENLEFAGCMNIDVPAGQQVQSIDLETGAAVLVPIPMTEGDRLEAMEKQFAAYVTGVTGGAGETGSDAVPFVYGMVVKKNHYYGYAGNVYQWKDNDCAACVWLPDSGIWQWEVVS